MTATTVLQAIGLFMATNIDDIIILSLFFARGAGQRGTTTRIALGQYLGFVGILSVLRCWSPGEPGWSCRPAPFPTSGSSPWRSVSGRRGRHGEATVTTTTRRSRARRSAS